MLRTAGLWMLVAQAPAVAPVRLAGPAPSDASADLPLERWVAAVLAAAALLIATAVVLRAVGLRRRPAAERAFDALARKMKLGPRRVGVVRRMAARAAMPPVALLISAHAFARASEAASEAVRNVNSRTLGPTPEQVEDVRRLLFGAVPATPVVARRRSA